MWHLILFIAVFIIAFVGTVIIGQTYIDNHKKKGGWYE